MIHRAKVEEISVPLHLRNHNMKPLFIQYPKCGTCRKAAKWLGLPASNGMVVKRPIIVGDDFVLLGFNEKEWKEKLR